MSSVANNHGAFAQQSLISPQKPPTPGNVQMPFYKRDAGGNSDPDCYPTEPPIRQRQHDYTGWSPLPAVNSPQWNEVSCDTTTSHTGGLPAAHSLLAFPPKSDPSSVSSTLPTTTVITNQNGKTFTAPTSSTTPAAYRYDEQQQQQQQYPPQYTLKRGSSYSGPRPSYLDGTAGVMTPMEYVDNRGDPYHSKSTAFQPLTTTHQTDLQFPPYRYNSGRGDKTTISVNGLPSRAKIPRRFPPADSTAGSPPASLASSDGETTTSSSATRGTSSISTTAVGSTTVAAQQRRPRKPAPTLATGRRNLKSEPVDPDEADRRMKRRERNRKSAQKCRERKLHRTQELQAQVEGLNMEASRLLREVEGWRDHARRCVELLRQHCPGVAVPYLSCLIESSEGYLLPSTVNTVSTATSIDPEPLTFCDVVEQPDGGFYNKGGGGGGDFSGPGPAGTASTAWTGRAFSQVASQLPPLSQFVPTPPPPLPLVPSSATSVVVKSEPPSGSYWKSDEAIDSFLSEVNHEGHEAEWKTENDTDSSSGCGAPPRLNTPNTNDGDKASNLSSSL
uniref:BZIP domain-containing protein n=1 Tax=Mesocestoides corti TaxID=53468 RepID=A0A5K3EQA0_MESCO